MASDLARSAGFPQQVSALRAWTTGPRAPFCAFQVMITLAEAESIHEPFRQSALSKPVRRLAHLFPPRCFQRAVARFRLGPALHADREYAELLAAGFGRLAHRDRISLLGWACLFAQAVMVAPRRPL